MSRLGALVVVLAMVLSACVQGGTERTVASTPATAVANVTTSPAAPLGNAATSSSGLATIPGGSVGLFASSLAEFDTCEAFLDHIKSVATGRVGPYGFESGPPIHAESLEFMEEPAAADAGTPVSSQPATAGVDYSTTNVQEVGVDEPDLVKTDGRRILAVGYGGLNYIDLSAGSPELRSSLPRLEWEGAELWNQQIFMRGDVALLMAYGFDPYATAGEPVTLVAEIDLSDPDEMRIAGTLMVEANFVSARLVGERVALVVSARPSMGSEFVYPSSDSESARERAEAANRVAIEESTLEHWVPRYELAVGTEGSPTEGALVDCSSGYAPQEFSGFDTLSVLTFDLSEGLDVGQVATVMSGGDTVYASTERLYVASHRWVDWDDADDDDVEGITTEIHRFDISGVDGPVYEASGSVDGFLLNQFAMSEHDGLLRVASTDRPNWWWQQQGSSESRVDVLERDGGELRVVGSVAGLGRGEQIFAVRFMGGTGYVVTFRQTDPLYSIDLSDPTDPRVVGELKILGYSAYLHPIGDGLLLGIGQDADQQGRISGTQISVFDVSDQADPIRIHQYTFPEFSNSEVEYDHHAFLYWPPTGIAVIPIGWWDYRESDEGWVSFNAAVVLDAGPEGIEELGRIRQTIDPDSDYEELFGYPLSDYMDSVPISRSLVVGDTLFTLSWLGLQASDLDTLSETSWIPFPSG